MWGFLVPLRRKANAVTLRAGESGRVALVQLESDAVRAQRMCEEETREAGAGYEDWAGGHDQVCGTHEGSIQSTTRRS